MRLYTAKTPLMNTLLRLHSEHGSLVTSMISDTSNRTILLIRRIQSKLYTPNRTILLIRQSRSRLYCVALRKLFFIKSLFFLKTSLCSKIQKTVDIFLCCTVLMLPPVCSVAGQGADPDGEPHQHHLLGLLIQSQGPAR